MALRIVFAAGPGNLIEAHKNWRANLADPSQMSATFSSEFEALCTEIGASAYIVSSAGPPALLNDGNFILEHRPKSQKSGLAYHIGELRYAFSLVKTAWDFKADYAVLQSGTTHYFAMSLFCLFGIKVIPVMHNTLWPAGFPPASFSARAISLLNSMFFRWGATATLAVSPECLRQVDKFTEGSHGPLHHFIIQFEHQSFTAIKPPPPKPHFKLLFSGRIVANKGVFDLLRIMRIVETRMPGSVTLDICGDGPDLDMLRSKCQALDLARIVTIHGWTAPEKLRALLNACHASIVPTRSEFAEGMAMTVIESILLERPVITNKVVPALEVLRSACIEAKTNDVCSYADAIVNISTSPAIYERLRTSCAPLKGQFFDRTKSFKSVLREVIFGCRNNAR